MDSALQRNTPPSLDLINGIAREDMSKVDLCIRENLQTPVPLISELAHHLFSAGGKRLRPNLSLVASHLCGVKESLHIAFATAIEFIHTATLLHDDVVDESTLRRGVETANQIWSNQACVLVGDFLFSRAFQILVQSKSLPALDVVSSVSSALAQGEISQLSLGRSTNISTEQYLEIVTAKTARLFEAACRVGAIASNATEEQVEALGLYGLNLGIAYQLTDDLLDYTAKQAVLGKTVGDDFREGKVTLPVILAFEKADENERYFWKRSLEQLDQNEKDLETAIELLRKYDVMTEVHEGAEYYTKKSISSLDIFPDSPAKHALVEAAWFSIRRYS